MSQLATVAVAPVDAAMPKELRVEVRLRNNRLRTYREKLGLTQKQAAILSGVSIPAVAALENLNTQPFGPRGWTKAALGLAALYSSNPEDLFPAAVMSVENPVVWLEVDAAELVPLLGATSADLALPPGDPVEASDLRECMDLTLNMLTNIERAVIRLRYGLDGEKQTCENIAASVGVSRERIRQIEARALRKLRHPSRSILLKECNNGTPARAYVAMAQEDE